MQCKTERTLLLLAAALPAILLGMVFVSGCRPSPTAPSAPVIQTAQENSEDFVGNETCKPCHAVEFGLHEHSNHAITMRPATSEALGALAPPTGAVKDTPFSISKENGGFTLARNDEAKATAVLQYALGSGKTVITYLGEMKKDSITELRVSWEPPLNKYCITPGQEQVPDAKIGVVNELGKAKQCVLCHSIKRKTDSSEPAPGFLGVGCESCHGAGRAHVEAAKSGKGGDLKMKSLRGMGGKEMNELCGKCHRTIDNLTSGALENNSTARFMPYGLALSPCFQKSDNKLTCVTCHNPHTNASKDQKAYEQACLNCHSAPKKVCPVNPKEKCVGCHMPQAPIFVFAKIPVTFADHFIWAYKPKGAGAKHP